MPTSSAEGPECSKCGAARRDPAAACPRCGLAADRMAAFARDRDARVPAALEDAWRRAQERWDDPAAHDELLRLAATQEAYPWLAARYRTRAGDPVAERQLARIHKAVEVTLLATAAVRDEPGTRSYRSVVALLVLLALFAVAGLVYVARMRDTPTPTPPASAK